jgi:hypothetical protein
MAEKVGTMSTALSPVEDRKQYTISLMDGVGPSNSSA